MSIGLVTTYTDNSSNQYFEIKDEYYIPSQSIGSGIFVTHSDYAIGCFYDHSLGKVYYNQYRDYSLPANSIYSNNAAIAQQQYTQNQIVTNNIQYVQNIVQQNITQTFVQAGFSTDPSQSLTKINSDIATLMSTAASFQTLLNNQQIILDADTTQLYNNSSQISSINIKLNQIIALLRNLNALSISNGSFNKSLNLFS